MNYCITMTYVLVLITHKNEDNAKIIISNVGEHQNLILVDFFIKLALFILAAL